MSTESVSPEAGIELNDHHCVSRSFLGSVHESNISRIEVPEHNAFHTVAGYRPPDTLMRKMGVAAITWHDEDGKSIPASVSEDLLTYLTPPDWRSLYVEGSILKPEDVPHDKNTTLAAVHMHTHLWEEQAMVSDAIAAVSTARYISFQTQNFLENIMAFFRADVPTDAIRTYLIEENHRKERKWTKPIMPKSFSMLCDFTTDVTPEYLTIKTRAALIETLINHHDRLSVCVKKWQPTVGNNTLKLAEYGQVLMEQALQRKKHKRSDIQAES